MVCLFPTGVPSLPCESIAQGINSIEARQSEVPSLTERYGGAGEGARSFPWINPHLRAMEKPMLITRRHAVGLATGAAVGSAALVLAGTQPGSAAAPQVTQEAAGYQTQPNGDQRCAFCVHFRAPASCEIVQGTIVPNGWCKLYRAKTS